MADPSARPPAIVGLERVTALPLDDADPAVRAALAEEGFGVLTEMDVAATLRAKIGVERAPLRILGACNPQLAHAALEAQPSVSLVLPCNVVLEEAGAGTRVSVADPRSLFDAPELEEVAADAAARLERALDRLPA
jgi:uncharacterized protein (DUF302 family)